MFKVISIFESIDGEVNGFHQGALTTFIRMSGCNLRCKYCDTTYSFTGGNDMTLDEVVDCVCRLKPRKITITGGEPLIYDEMLHLINKLILKHGFKVSVETNGTLPKLFHDANLSWVFDYKLPSSGMEHKMRVENFVGLSKSTDWVKFVISDEQDFERALEVREILEKSGVETNFAYSPVPEFSTDKLLQLLLTHGKGDEVLSIQIHKLIWPNCGAVEEH